MRDPQPIQRRHHAVNRREFAVERGPVPGLVFAVPALSEFPAQLRLECVGEVGFAPADETIHDLLQLQLQLPAEVGEDPLVLSG
ncbi:hypothetical protein ACOM2C_17885 [Pseudarthrobacter sp. So.54]